MGERGEVERRKHGSLGSRLTGAGWGGCAVHLVPEEKVEAFLAAMKEESAWNALRNSTMPHIIISTSCKSASTAVKPLLKSNRMAT